jgi:diguanylate cyclase (GGDEF)-like protein
MLEASELLRSYVRILRRLAGADCVSLFVPASASGATPSLLIHDGDGPAAELRDVASAERLRVEGPGRTRERLGAQIVFESATPGSLVLALPAARPAWVAAETADADRDRRRTDPGRDPRPAAWLGLRLAPGGRLASSDEPIWTALLGLGGELAGHAVQVSAVLRDPVTGVPGRAAFQGVLAEELEKSRLASRPLCLLLVNPDDFAAVNQRLGREAGDDVIRELVSRLRGSLRGSDLVAKYGGVIYGALLLGTDLEVAREVSAKVLRSLGEPAYRDGATLRCSIGLAAADPDDLDVRQPLDLIRRADQALNAAKRSGGGRVVVWEPGGTHAGVGPLDRMTGIFTGDMASDYRNMVLLWDAVTAMAASDTFDRIARHVVARLYSAFEPDRVAVLLRPAEGPPSLLIGLGRTAAQDAAPRTLETLEHTAAQADFVARAAEDPARTAASVHVGPGALRESETHAYYVPLIARDEALGGLYLDAPAPLESADLIFLEALAAQLAVALDRSRGAERERLRQQQQQERLQAELDQLRRAVQHAKLEYRSPQMDLVLATARRVAPTDATVLIMGESGTGKELLARTIHELSPRRHKPLVVVDCSAIASTLADAELFGHERGAYTGANEMRQGRLAEADGGTVLLDEIGELPLEVQGKLLRFVQEKQLTSVGATRPRAVDVRIVAASNRQLDHEVAEGRFRADLYHRLNVVKLLVPALRDRHDDVLHLARHFLAMYAVLYHRPVRRFAPAGERALVAYSWPGNVRELQNRIQQAVILCEGEEVGPGELGLGEKMEARSSGLPVAAPLPPWERLRTSVGRQVEAAGAGPDPRPVPLGRWLVAEAALAANELATGVGRRAAALLGVPETTFRRLHRKAADDVASGLAQRPPAWDEVREAVRGVLQTPAAGQDVVGQLERVLLDEIVRRTPEDERLRAVLLGVSLPTLRLRLDAFRRSSS